MDTNEQKPGAHGAGDSKPFVEHIVPEFDHDFGDTEARVRSWLADACAEPRTTSPTGRRSQPWQPSPQVCVCPACGARPPMVHELKIDEAPYCAVRDGSKRAEIRAYDRDYRVGDVLVLRAFDRGLKSYLPTPALRTSVVGVHECRGYLREGFVLVSLGAVVEQ